MENFVFRFPADHVEQIQESYQEFLSLLQLYADQPHEINKRFEKLLYDLSHVIHHHPFAKEFADNLFSFLETHPESLRGDIRLQLVQAIIVLHNKEVIDTITAIEHLIPLFRLNDKTTRRCIYGHFINRIPFHQTTSTKHALQKFISNEYDSRVCFKTLQLIVDIFYKENKEDMKTINFIARCLNSNDSRIINIIVSFFLDPYVPKVANEDVDLEEERRKAELSLKVSGKTRSRESKLSKVKKMRVQLPQDPVQVISFIDDPQKFSIRLFSLLSAPENGKTFKTRESQIRATSLLSKIISVYQLDFDQFFNWAARFIRPQYDEVTKMLAIIASAVHPLTTPETLTDLLKTVADRFIVPNVDEEVVVVGLNTIREICAKNPHGMTKELLSDLVLYKKETVKGVVVAARSIIQLYREVNPELLPKRERGKPDEEKVVEPKSFGEIKTETTIKGAETIASERLITQEEFDELSKGKEVVDEDDDQQNEVDEDTILEGSRIHKATKEEKIERALEGKSKHVYHSKMADKTAGFSNKEKLKKKPFMLTRFRKESSHNRLKDLNAIQKAEKKREAVLKQKYS